MKKSRALRPTGEPARAIRVQRIVDRELPLHVLEVVSADLAEPACHGIEAPGFGNDLARVGVGAPHDERRALERRIRQTVLLDEGVEGAALPVMSQLDARHIVRGGALAARRVHDLRVGNEQELRLLVDEAPYKPGAGDAIHAGLDAGDPLHGVFHSSSSRSSRERIAARAAGSPSLTAGTSVHRSTRVPGVAASPSGQPKATTRSAP